MRNPFTTTVSTLAAIFILSGTTNGAELLDQKTQELLSKHCVRCHSESATNLKAKKDIPNILDVNDLIARKMLVPGDLVKSKIWTEVENGSMPDDASDDISKYPSLADKEALKAFILDLKSKVTAVEEKRIFQTDGDILKYIFDDISQTTHEQAKQRRYFTLTHLHNNDSILGKDLESYRLSLTKMLNSLSWKRNVIKPVAVDPERTVFRIDLREIGWNTEQWEKLAKLSPYNKYFDSIVGVSLANQLETYVPAIRADWFVAKVSRPPLYHEFADIPETVAELEKRLIFGNLTAVENRKLNPYEVARAGVRKSGVSLQNRMIERHPAQFGAYWLSYDFKKADPTDQLAARKDFFRFPTGPEGDSAFLHDGGEYIFNLPNGFQAYMLSDSAGKRIDAGPTDIVFDRNAAAESRDPTITNGFSCISCHSAGINRVNDELFDAVQNSGFDLGTKDQVALFHSSERLLNAYSEDENRFKVAMASAGIKNLSVSEEPISKIVNQFETVLVNVKSAAAELGLREAEFINALARLEGDRALLGIKRQLESTGMPREQFIAAFDAIARAIKIQRSVPDAFRTDEKSAEEIILLKRAIKQGTDFLETPAFVQAAAGTALSSLKFSHVVGEPEIAQCTGVLVFHKVGSITNTPFSVAASETRTSSDSNGVTVDFGQTSLRINDYYAFCGEADPKSSSTSILENSKALLDLKKLGN